jgi:hypothetical protein
MIKNSVTPTHERAKLLGELVSTTLAKALHDKRPDVAAQARFTKQTIIDRLDELKANAHNIGKDGMDLLRKGMKSKDADIRAESTAIYKAATSSTKNLPATGTAEGSAFTHNVASGMTSQSALQDIKDASQTITRIAHLYVHTASPAKLGPWSEDGGPEAWGRRFTTLLAKGIAGGVPDVHAAFNGLRRPNLAASLAFPHAGSVAGAGHTFATSSTVASNHVTIGEVHVHGVGSDVSPGAAKRFGQQIVDEMGKTFRQQGARIGLHPAVVP